MDSYGIELTKLRKTNNDRENGMAAQMETNEYVDSLRHISRQTFTIHKLKGRGNTFSQTLSAAI